MSMIGIAACFGCKKPFAFNPELVPTVAIDPLTRTAPDLVPVAERAAARARAIARPLCPDCCVIANVVRARAGLELFDETDTSTVPWQ